MVLLYALGSGLQLAAAALCLGVGLLALATVEPLWRPALTPAPTLQRAVKPQVVHATVTAVSPSVQEGPLTAELNLPLASFAIVPKAYAPQLPPQLRPWRPAETASFLYFAENSVDLAFATQAGLGRVMERFPGLGLLYDGRTTLSVVATLGEQVVPWTPTTEPHGRACLAAVGQALARL